MKTLYIECNMGAAGDMLMAALSELIDAPEDFVREMNGLGLPGVRFERRPATKCGMARRSRACRKRISSHCCSVVSEDSSCLGESFL